MYCNSSIFHLNEMMNMPDRCEVCGQKMEIEVGFYYGTGYVSYALTVALLAATFVGYWILIGLSYKDNSIFYALGTAIGIALVTQPWLMRLSRVLYLYMFVRYGQNKDVKN